jgi:transposase
MTQKERDRLVALKKAKKKLITQKQAAAEMGVSERQVRRMLRKWKERGDRTVLHAARGRRSNRKIAAQVKQQAIEILSQEVYRGFGPTLAAEYLAKKHHLHVGRETLRGWMKRPSFPHRYQSCGTNTLRGFVCERVCASRRKHEF